jgi:hypothetical protein
LKNTKLYIAVNGDYRELDITDIEILLQFEEVNIRSFESLKAEHSKTITLVGTQNNNDILGYLYDITTSSSFDVLKAAPCYISSENNILFEGSFKLVNVTINPNGVKEYECVLTANTLDFFDDLKTLRLKDIDLSDFDHTLTKANVENSWATSVRYQNSNVPFELGFGYVYPLEFRGVQDIGYLWSPKDMSPAIYLKTLIDKGLAQLGYNYRSEFFNSNDFKRLIMPNVYQRVPLLQSEIDCKQFDGTQTGAALTELNSVIGINLANNFIPNGASDLELTFRGTMNDPCGINQGTYFTINGQGDYTINISHTLEVFIDIDPSESYTSYRIRNQSSQPAKLNYRISFINYSTNTVLSFTEKQITIPDDIQTSNFSFTDSLNATYSSYFGNGFNVGILVTITSLDVIYALRQDNAQMVFRVQVDTDEDIALVLTSPYCEEGDTISLNRCINNSTTLFDIFKDLGKMFNLRYEFENDDKTITIEPATKYYSDGVVKDWSKKIDDNQPILIETISDLDYNSLKFHYVEDGDYHNKYTVDTYDGYYGEQVVTIENDWSDEERVIKTDTVASTPNVNHIGDICTPYYVTYEGGNYKPMSEIKPRILIYGGLIQANSNWCWISKLVPYTANNIISNLRSTYPFAGHIDRPYNQTWDINFGVRPAYYWNYNSITDNNLYNRFYKQFIDSELNPDTKILTAYFNLTDEDIYKFKYNDKIFIDNSYYRVNKIIDYNPVKSELTKVESVKVIDADVFISQARIINPNDWINVDTIGDTRGGGGGGAIPVGDATRPTGNNEAFARIVNGYGNNVSENSFNVSINGNNNLVQANSLNVSITGDNNQVLNGVTNVVIIGSGIVITESNTTYIEGIGYINNGVLVPQFNIVDGMEDEVQSPFGDVLLNVVDAGEDVVQCLNTDFNINIIEI